MEHIVICSIGFTILFFAGIFPSIRKKRWKAVGFAIPVFAVTLVLSVLKGLGVELVSINQMISDVVSGLFGVK